MFWNESLKIGVEQIDEQHKTLFSKVSLLIGALKAGRLVDGLDYTGDYQREKIISTILFLKEYAVTHFADEEAYQVSINDANHSHHKKLHDSFIATVLKHEKKMVASDFSYMDVCEFTGTLLAWLTYHVSDVDQKIGGAAENAAAADSCADIIRDCFCDVISVETGRHKDSILRVKDHKETFDNSILFKHSFAHRIKGYVVFDYSVSFINELMRSLMEVPPHEIGNFEKAFLRQISTQIIESVYERLGVEEYELNDADIYIAKKDEARPDERIAFDTGIGIVEVGFTVQ